MTDTFAEQMLRGPHAARIAGVDEAGRGPLAGPVIAAAVVLDPQRPIAGIADSKQLGAARREQLDAQIRERAIACALGRADAEEIDRINILQATLAAMRRAVEALRMDLHLACIDGNIAPPLPCRAVAVVRGDARVAAIGAASILAKVARDAEMRAAARHYPEYGFERHKGYATQAHRDALQRFGPTPLHRRSFAPVARVLGTGSDARYPRAGEGPNKTLPSAEQECPAIIDGAIH